MKLSDLRPEDLLEQEYAPKHARRQQARAVQQRRIEHQRQALDAAPIADATELSRAAARLADAWGLKRKRTKAH